MAKERRDSSRCTIKKAHNSQDAETPVRPEARHEPDHMIEDAQEALQKLPEPRISSLCQMLKQSLISHDKVMLEGALSVTDLALVADSIRALPAESLLPLLDALVQRIEGRPWRAGRLVPWLMLLLQTHALALSQQSRLSEHLAPLKGLIEARCRSYRRLVALRGKLDLMLSMAEESLEGGDRRRAEQMHSLLATPLAIFDDAEDDFTLADEMMDGGDDDGTEDDSDRQLSESDLSLADEEDGPEN